LVSAELRIRSVGRQCILHLGAIGRFLPGVRQMLGLRGWWMLEALEGVLNVSGHGDIAGALVIVPIDGETTVAASCPVLANLVLLFECQHEVLGIGLISVFDAEVIHNKHEGEITYCVLPESRGDRDWLVAVGSKELLDHWQFCQLVGGRTCPCG